jgi:hypothetical protein
MLSPGWACRLQGPEPGHRPPSFYGVRTGDKEIRCDWAPTCGPPGTYICIYTYLAETSHRTLRPGMATVIARRSGGTVNLHGYARDRAGVRTYPASRSVLCHRRHAPRSSGSMLTAKFCHA